LFFVLLLTCAAVRYRAGAVIPYLPLRHLPVVGLASKSYTFLGFRVAPGTESGFGAAYEDDGATTAYLGGHYGYTSLQYSRFSPSGFNAVISPAVNSTQSMAQRSYQVRMWLWDQSTVFLLSHLLCLSFTSSTLLPPFPSPSATLRPAPPFPSIATRH
jgi:hypothetical protein